MERSFPALHKFAQCMHIFCNKFVYNLHKFVHLHNMEMLNAPIL